MIRCILSTARLAVVALLVIGALPVRGASRIDGTSAAQPIPVKVFSNQVSQFYNLSDLVPSPDGHFMAYTLLTSTDSNKESSFHDCGQHTVCTIWVADMWTQTTHALTGAEEASLLPSWSPDGMKLAFYSDHDGTLKLWIWDRQTGTMHALPGTDRFVNGEIQWTPDSHTILAKFTDSSPSNATQDLGYISPAPPSNTPIVLSYSPVSAALQAKARDAIMFRPHNQVFLGSVWANGLSPVQRIGPNNVSTFALSPDGTHIVVGRETLVLPESNRYTCEHDLVDVRTGAYRTLTKGDGDVLQAGCGQPAWSADGLFIGYFTSTVGLGNAHLAGSVVIVNIASGRIVKNPLQFSSTFTTRRYTISPRWSNSDDVAYVSDARGLWRYKRGRFELIAKTVGSRAVLDLPIHPDGKVWSPDGVSLDVLVGDRVTRREGIERFSLRSGNFTTILTRDIYLLLTDWEHNGVIALPKGSFALEAEDAIHPQELWIMESGKLHQIGETNPQLVQYVFGKSKLIQLRHGKLLEGGLLLPVGYRPGHRYPLVVWVYPGANGADAVNQFGLAWFNMQLLASRGYAVLYPNQPSWAGEVGRSDFAGYVIPLIKELAHDGYIDENRVAVMGQSGGGYDVAAIITETTLFKAAVMIDGPSDLVSDYFSMDEAGNEIGAWRDERMFAGATPWTGLRRYIENSPVFYLKRVQTPLLILQGAADSAVPTEQADEMFVGLRRLNKEVQYVRYPGEGHVMTGYTSADQEDWWNRVIRWLNQYLQ